MSAINFNSIPADIRVPFMTMEFDSSRATTGAQAQPYRAILFGQKLPTGTAETGKPILIHSLNQAKSLFGISSMLAELVDYYRRVDVATELWALAVPDNEDGIQASAKISFSGSAASPGILYTYIAGQRITVSIAAGDQPAAVVAACITKVNNVPELPVTAAEDDGVLVLKAKQPGDVGNEIDLRFNYHTGESFPTGISATIQAFSGGAANPDLTDAIAKVAGEWFNGFVSPYTDPHNLLILTEEMARRNGPLVQQEGWVFGVRRGEFGDLCAFGNAHNTEHVCIMHGHGVPSSPWCFAATIAANAMYYGNIDPARPFQTLPCPGILAPNLEDRFTDFPENNQLLQSGISIFKSLSDSSVQIGRLITTYKTNEAGADDTAYLDLNTGMTLSYIRYSWRQHLQKRFPRHKLGNDNVKYNGDEAIVTPMLAKAETAVIAREWEKRGLMENVDTFIKNLVVVRDASPNRLNFLMDPDLMNQFIVGAAKARFIL